MIPNDRPLTVTHAPKCARCGFMLTQEQADAGITFCATCATTPPNVAHQARYDMTQHAEPAITKAGAPNIPSV